MLFSSRFGASRSKHAGLPVLGHVTEVVYHLYNCFSYLAHKQGDSLIALLGDSSTNQLHRFHSTETIHAWAVTLMDLFRVSLHDGVGNQNRIMLQIQEYIENNLQSEII